MEGLLPIFVIALVLIFKASLGKRKDVVPEWEGNDEEVESEESTLGTKNLELGTKSEEELGVESEIAGDHEGRPYIVKGEIAGDHKGRPYIVKGDGTLKVKSGGDGHSIARGFKEDARRAFIYSEIFKMRNEK